MAMDRVGSKYVENSLLLLEDKVKNIYVKKSKKKRECIMCSDLFVGK